MNRIFLSLFAFLCSFILITNSTFPTYAEEPVVKRTPRSSEESPPDTPQEQNQRNQDQQETQPQSEQDNQSNQDQQPTDNADKEKHTTDDKSKQDSDGSSEESSCTDVTGMGGWVICLAIDALSKITDGVYGVIESFLPIDPITSDTNSTIHLIWEYARNLTNILFIIFLIVVVYSQLTGLGLSNYGIKRVLPRIIIAVVLVNLSFVICQVATDTSNILGSSLRGFFESIKTTIIANSSHPELNVNFSEIVGSVLGGTVLTLAAGSVIVSFAGGILSVIATILSVLLPGLIAVIIGLITIALRQALIPLLTMISPLAFVCFLLPNTEKWFTKWKDLFIKMLVFYPAFSALFGVAQLAGWAIINSSVVNGEADALRVILGLAVQILPLFFSWSLMKMSGTILGTVNQKLSDLASKPSAGLKNWANSHAQQERFRFFNRPFARKYSLGAKSRKWLDYRSNLRETDISNMQSVYNNDIAAKVYKRMSGNDTRKPEVFKANRYSEGFKEAKNKTAIANNAIVQADIVAGHYSDYFDNNTKRSKRLIEEGRNAWIESTVLEQLRAIHDEDDIEYLTDVYFGGNKRDANGLPVKTDDFRRYITASCGGEEGEHRVIAKVVTRASNYESRRRAETYTMMNKFGFNGYNKHECRCWLAGYYIDDDGWATDKNGNRLKDDEDRYIETIPGQILTKAPERMVLYDKRDKYGLYFDMKDQDGNIISRIHRGTGDDGLNHDDAAFTKEVLANFDLPIGDPINDVYSILAGIKPGKIITPQGRNEIGLARYSTTIGRALADYKSNAAWAGAMFNSMVGNRQIHNAAQMAIDVCDSIIKTAKPGALNTQNPASINLLLSILDPDNWNDIFREEDIMDGVNINNKAWGGENWVEDENGILDINNFTKGNIQPVDNPTYEQRMNTIKRKFLFPALQKIKPAIIRNTTPNTADNQKPGASDAFSNLIDMIETKWENNPNLPDPNLNQYDLLGKTRDFKAKQHDRDGNLIYGNISRHPRNIGEPNPNTLSELMELYYTTFAVSQYINGVVQILNETHNYRALEEFDNWIHLNGNADKAEIQNFVENDLVSFLN